MAMVAQTKRLLGKYSSWVNNAYTPIEMIIVSKDHQELVSFRSLWCLLANVLDPQDPTYMQSRTLEALDSHQLVVRVKF